MRRTVTKRNNRRRKGNAIFSAQILTAGLLFCFLPVLANAQEETWTIAWYLCGSDLESEDGAATADLLEMMEANLPDSVQVVIETGGASKWQNEEIDPGELGRYLYWDGDFYYLESAPLANMGDADTLSDFLSFCHEEFPADHEMVVFWNHGGGSVGGVAYDELYGYDSLSLNEIHDAFEQVYDLDEKEPPLELVGFDACLMATMDTAGMLSDISHYMVASEEMEPGGGWEYSKWMSVFAKNPDADGAVVGKAICDTFILGCEETGEAEEATLSLIDLSRWEPLKNAYDAMGKEALEQACQEETFVSRFGRSAEEAKSFGGNSKRDGYTNLVDLGDLVKKSRDILPQSADAVLDALNDCVIYSVNGKYEAQASGLSCYYSYNHDQENLEEYSSVAVSSSVSSYFEYLLNGYVDSFSLQEIFVDVQEQDTYDYGKDEVLTLEDLFGEDLVELPYFDEEEEEVPVYIDDDGYATLELTQEDVNKLKSIYVNLSYMDPEEDFMIFLGTDNDLYFDWDAGIFKDNFRGVWGSIDGCLCYMELIEEEEDYNLYTVPILLNGEDCNLHVVYDYEYEDYFILGARSILDENGMSDKNLVQLKPGDEITTLLYMGDIESDEDLELYEWETIEVTEDTCFMEQDLGDGLFCLYFELVDVRNESIWSEPVWITVEDGMIYAEV